jgi:peptidoglycan/LPS O-acetylase OafA/YrhL
MAAVTESLGRPLEVAIPRTTAQFKMGYIPALDGLRGISILAVMFHHGYLFWMGRGGFLGVDVFFVLSGFLITALLVTEWEKTGSISFKKFYSRRILRLFPALWALILVSLVRDWFIPPPEGYRAVVKSVLIVFFYSSNWVQAVHPLGHTWSLAIEEQFYIIWPALLLLMLKLGLGKKWTVGTVAVLIGLIALHRGRMYLVDYSSDPLRDNFRIYAGTDTRGDALLVGCLVGLLLVWRMVPARQWFMRAVRIAGVTGIAFVAVLMFWAPIYWKYLYYGAYTLVAVSVGTVILWLNYVGAPWLKRVLEYPLLVWIGKLSYSLYLWHVMMYVFGDLLIPKLHTGSYTLNIMAPLAVKVAASFAMASLSYYLIERPFLRLKKKVSVV